LLPDCVLRVVVGHQDPTGGYAHTAPTS